MVVRKNPLRDVKPGESSRTGPRKLTLDQAIELGDALEIALAQRRDIAEKLKEARGAPASALHLQLSKTSDKIELLQSRVEQEKRKRGEVTDEVFDAEAI